MHWIDPDHLPEITGTVDQFLVDKHGEADGFLLTDGEEVHVPPHLSAPLLRDVRPGSQVKVRGVRPRGVRMIAAVAIDTPKGRMGPDALEDDAAFEKAEHGPMSAQGIVKRSIHGPKGETRGAVLEDGRIIRLPPHEAERFSALLTQGAKIFVAGEGATTSSGTVVEAREIGASAETMQVIDPKKSKHGPDHKGPKHHGKKHGPKHGESGARRMIAACAAMASPSPPRDFGPRRLEIDAMTDTTEKPLRFLQIGDLHITDAGLQNHVDLRRIVDEVNGNAGERIDFVYLPDDNADDGTPEQFRIVHDELSRLIAPWHAIPGDHDFKPGSLDNFYGGLHVPKLPYVVEISSCSCIFLDVVSRGTGGPDFRLGEVRLAWLRSQLDAAQRDSKTAAVFMHAYPADLGEEAAEIAAMFDESPVALVGMGHTQYNEISHDGRTVYAATRSTGQIEEGRVGFAFVAIDRGALGWRFKPLKSSWPFVMITSPADRRLATAPHSDEGNVCREVRASAWGAVPIAQAEFRVDDQPWRPMVGGDSGLFGAKLTAPGGSFRLSVRVTDQQRNQDTDTIDVAPYVAAEHKPTGSDACSIGTWPARHLLGTQLGPNRNGRKW
jgi:Icc protein